MTKRLTCGSLFSGVGGFDLGLERAGFQIEWQVENDDYCRKVLQKHWPAVPCHYDITTIDWQYIPRVDLLCAGFPCQDVSFAGKRAGIHGSRSSLWFEVERAIRDLRPRWVLVENTKGLLARGMGTVLEGLAKLGFDAEWRVLSACMFGAPHMRQRVFIVAYPQGIGQGQLRWEQCEETSEGTRYLHWPQAEPGCERVVDGVPYRLERLTATGNAIVPQIAEALGRMILEAHKAKSPIPETMRCQ